jgi:hypothetical protein
MAMRKSEDGSYTITAPGFKAEGVEEPPQEITWVSHDMGPAVIALIKNHETRASEILGKTFFLGYRTTFPKFARALSEGMCAKMPSCYEDSDILESSANGKDVRFSSAEGQAPQLWIDMASSIATYS